MLACSHSNHRKCIANLHSYGVNDSCPLRRSPLEGSNELFFGARVHRAKYERLLAEGDTKNDYAELAAMIAKL